MQHGFMQPKWNMNYFVTGVLCCQKRNFQKVLLADQLSEGAVSRSAFKSSDIRCIFQSE